MDNAVPEWTIDYQTISFQSLGIQSPLRVYHNEENPAEGTRVDLGSLHMIMFGESYQIGFEQIFLHDGTNLIILPPDGNLIDFGNKVFFVPDVLCK